jgi:hypothetical protein
LGKFGLDGTNLVDISVAEGNLDFKVCGNFLVDFEGHCVKKDFGNETVVFIPASIERLDVGCSANCRTLLTVIVESDSKLRCIEGRVFGRCSSLVSICIPSCVEELCQ